MKRHPQNGREWLQIGDLVRDLYLEYFKHFCPTVKRQMTQLKNGQRTRRDISAKNARVNNKLVKMCNLEGRRGNANRRHSESRLHFRGTGPRSRRCVLAGHRGSQSLPLSWVYAQELGPGVRTALAHSGLIHHGPRRTRPAPVGRRGEHGGPHGAKRQGSRGRAETGGRTAGRGRPRGRVSRGSVCAGPRRSLARRAARGHVRGTGVSRAWPPPGSEAL